MAGWIDSHHSHPMGSEWVDGLLKDILKELRRHLQRLQEMIVQSPTVRPVSLGKQLFFCTVDGVSVVYLFVFAKVRDLMVQQVSTEPCAI